MFLSLLASRGCKAGEIEIHRCNDTAKAFVYYWNYSEWMFGVCGPPKVNIGTCILVFTDCSQSSNFWSWLSLKVVLVHDILHSRQVYLAHGAGKYWCLLLQCQIYRKPRKSHVGIENQYLVDCKFCAFTSSMFHILEYGKCKTLMTPEFRLLNIQEINLPRFLEAEQHA